MAKTVTLATLRAEVQARGQYEGSADITTTLLNSTINSAIAEVYDLLVARWADYYVTRANLSTVVGVDTVTLPSDFYKLRKVEIVDSSSPSGYRSLHPMDLSVSHAVGTTVWRKGYRYRLEAGTLVLMPTPVAVETLRIFYIAYAPVLVADADTWDTINQYDELVVQTALLKCKQREELPTDDIEREIVRLTMRIRSAADGRDATMPMLYNAYGPDDDRGGWGW